MADNFLNTTGLAYYHNRIKNLFADAQDFADLQDTVEGLVTEGGEPNVIETVKVNNVALVPDAQKAVNVDLSTYALAADVPTATSDLTNDSGFVTSNDLPTAVSDLTNDGDGVSPFATQAYVAANGGAINTISVNGTPQTITNKNVDLTVPTAVSDLTNDSGFQDATDVQDAIDAALADITSFDFEEVQTLPATGQKGIIYLVPKTSGTGFEEYIWVTPTGGAARFEQIGDTDIDLSNYWTSTTGQNNTLVAITTSEIDAIVVGA